MCELCGEGPAVDWDHDHSSGLVRGKVCRRCNIGMRYVDDEGWLIKAIAYRESPPLPAHIHTTYGQLCYWRRGKRWATNERPRMAAAGARWYARNKHLVAARRRERLEKERAAA